MVRFGKEQHEKLKLHLAEDNNYCLHFDGKRLAEVKRAKKFIEHQVICLQRNKTGDCKMRKWDLRKYL